MAETHVISGLTKKRAEIAGEIIQLSDLLKTKEKELEALDNTIRIFNPDYVIENIKPKKKSVSRFGHGELSKVVLNAIKTATEPLTSHQISEKIKAERNIAEDIRPNVQECLYRLKKQELIIDESLNDNVLVYKVGEL